MSEQSWPLADKLRCISYFQRHGAKVDMAAAVAALKDALAERIEALQGVITLAPATKAGGRLPERSAVHGPKSATCQLEGGHHVEPITTSFPSRYKRCGAGASSVVAASIQPDPVLAAIHNHQELDEALG